jgi:hypothetical protein
MFVSSGMRRREFCQSRGLSFSTLDRHLQKRRWKRQTRSAPAQGKLVAVDLAIRKPPSNFEEAKKNMEAALQAAVESVLRDRRMAA